MSIVAIALVSMLLQGQASSPHAALFDQGKTWEEFLVGVDARQDTWKANAARSKPPAALVERLKAAGTELRLLVVTVPACGDSVHTVPYIAALAREAGVTLRIVDPTLGKPVMEAHRTPDGRAATATVALFRGDRLVGAWVERPEAIQTWTLGPGSSLPQEERGNRKASWYDWDRGESTMAELVALAEKLK